jgi:3-hydroxyisobutyrate dehydrogenase-like beta-hydroxyacid dehydrogenase
MAVKARVGFVGLGKIGYAMANNMIKAGVCGSEPPICFDLDKSAMARLSGAVAAESPEEVGSAADIVFTVLPNDLVLHAVAYGADGKSGLNAFMADGTTHVSCSTVGPWSSRAIAASHRDVGIGFVAAPVFARPDGMAAAQATIPVSGASDQIARIKPYLEATATGVYTTFGEDPGAANVVKLAGNFLIAAAIESLAEALAMAEANGVDREATHQLLTDTIFNCLIYKGYGQRVALRDHAPYSDAHFALSLGRKDVALVREAATRANVAMPIASLLVDRFASAVAKGRGELDWSAIGMAASEDSGVDVSAWEERSRRPNPELGWLPPVK